MKKKEQKQKKEQQPPFAQFNRFRMNEEIKKNIDERIANLYTKENMDYAAHS